MNIDTASYPPVYANGLKALRVARARGDREDLVHHHVVLVEVESA